MAKKPKKKIPPVADRLAYYVEDEQIPLFVDQNGEAHAFVDGEALPIARSNRYLTGLLHDREKTAPSNDGLVGAKRVLDMKAHRTGDVRELHTRACFHEGTVYIQLRPGCVVRVDEHGWKLDPNPPVTFRSVKNLRPLPDPKRGGKLEDLLKYVNLKTRRDIRLYLTYVTLVALAHIPRPILEATGVMGSGKSTASRVVKRLLDPTNSEAVTMDKRDFLQKASHCFLLMLDNQNSLPEWALDTLCRLVTGESDSKRVLYTDDEDLVWSMKRAVILNGINPPSERGDVQDRTLPIELERIPKGERLPEDDFWMQFDLEKPELLGAVFDALAGALRRRHTVKLAERPRLADWGLYAAALYESQGWGVDTFVEDWKCVEKTQQQGTLDGSIVAQIVIYYMRDKTRVEMTASKLHAGLEACVEDDMDLSKDRDWPKTGRTLWKRIREVTPLLEAHLIKASRKPDNRLGRPIVLEKVASSEDNSADDNADDKRVADDSADDNSRASSATFADDYADTDDNGANGRYFGTTNSSDRKEGEEQGESGTDLSSASSVNGSKKPGRRLTEDEAHKVQTLISQGMKPEIARREVLGVEA